MKYTLNIPEEMVKIAEKKGHPVDTVDNDGVTECYATTNIKTKDIDRLISINDMMNKLKAEKDAIVGNILDDVSDYLESGPITLTTANGTVTINNAVSYNLDDMVAAIYEKDPESRFVEVKPTATITLKNTVKNFEAGNITKWSIGEAVESFLKDVAADADIVAELEECELTSKAVKSILKGKVKMPKEAAETVIGAMTDTNASEITEILGVDDFAQQYSRTVVPKVQIASVADI